MNVAGEDKVSFQIKSFGLFGPGPRQAPPKPVSPPKATDDQMDMEVIHHSIHYSSYVFFYFFKFFFFFFIKIFL